MKNGEKEGPPLPALIKLAGSCLGGLLFHTFFSLIFVSLEPT